ncbi:MAG: nitrile hydratase subunit alpha [Acidobacteria bacterium]|nr:nitrile hydratase subunit alpha [Acidobacteriota bacterium]MBV9069085.1 nitrile hydratase subunit alpha [Acidobacteriota bacterium]MBV9186367.1 nitrile hydratase subunit alpha [Acidobacteriota bacterium]
MSASEATTTMDQVAKVITKAATDPAFRNQLLTSAATALQSQGITVPAGTSLQVLENSGTLVNLVIPAKPANLSGDAAQEVTSLASSNAAPTSTLDAYAKLVIDSWQDADLKQRLFSDPAAVLTERGFPIPPGLNVRALEATSTNSFVVLPAAQTTSTAGLTIGEVASSITASFSNLSKLITAGSYLAGLAFSIGAIMKFKQHKDNPTQVPIGTPIALVFIAAALLFLPSIPSVVRSSMFGGGGGTTAGPSGTVFTGS